MLIYCFLSFLLGILGAWVVGRYGASLGLVDVPNHRSSHTLPTPKGGGIGIVLAFVAGSVFYGIPAGFYLPAAALSMFSLFGDRVDIRPLLRLLVQFICAFLVLGSLEGLASHSLFAAFLNGGALSAGLALLLSAVFVVGTANFYNFMDGINGIASITAIVGFCLLAVYGMACQKDARLVMLCLGLAAACAGFLPFNVPAARVFMGDVGSVLLGFIFAVIVIAFSADLAEFVLLAGFLFPFYADELITMAERIRDRQSLTEPHRRHLYQVFANEGGVAHWKISVGYGLVQLFVGIFLWRVARIGGLEVVTAFIALGLAGLFVNKRFKSWFV